MAALPGRAAAARKPDYRFIDVLPAFDRLLERRLAGAAAIDAYQRSIVQPHRRAFDLIEPIDAAQLAEYLSTSAAARPAMRQLSRSFPDTFAALWRNFDAVLPQTGRGTSVYLLPAPEDALGGSARFDGQRHYVLIGAEVMSFLEQAGVSGRAFIQHALAHLHHQQQNEEIRDAARAYFAGASTARLYQILWLEGLAVHVSQRLNETATEFDLLRSRDIGVQVAAVWPELRDTLRASFDSTDRALIQRLVFEGDPARSLPAKAGYYIGYRLAGRIAATRELRELPRLGGAELRMALLGALDELRDLAP